MFIFGFVSGFEMIFGVGLNGGPFGEIVFDVEVFDGVRIILKMIGIDILSGLSQSNSMISYIVISVAKLSQRT